MSAPPPGRLFVQGVGGRDSPVGKCYLFRAVPFSPEMRATLLDAAMVPDSLIESDGLAGWEGIDETNCFWLILTSAATLRAVFRDGPLNRARERSVNWWVPEELPRDIVLHMCRTDGTSD